MTDTTPQSEPRTPGRGPRALVIGALVLLLVPGIIGFDAWPLTAWRLFSLARDDDQTRWVLEAETADGDTRVVSLEELPLRYRNAEWQMAELPGSGDDQRDAVCRALADAVVRVEPTTSQVRIVRDRQTLVDRGGSWDVVHEPEVLHTCEPTGDR